MGREVRRVPPTWQHPKDDRGHYRPLLDSSFAESMREWQEGKAAWEAPGSAERARVEAKYGPHTWEEWESEAPDPNYYRPEWTDAEATSFQVYENVTEGTPISPVFATREALVDWLVNVGDRMGLGGVTLRLSREAAERFVDAGYAPSAVAIPGVGLMSGAQSYEHPAPSEGKEPTRDLLLDIARSAAPSSADAGEDAKGGGK